MAMIFCNTLLYSSSPFLSPLPSIRSKPSRFSKRVLTVQAQFQSMDQNDLLLRQKFMEFPYVSPSRRELMADLMSTLEDRLHSQLLPCSLPTDVRNFKNPNGSAEASLHIRSGEKSSPIDFVIGSWIHVKIPTGVSLNITSISAFLNSSTEAPNFVVELIQSSPTSLVLILDLPHRKDLVRHPDYLQTFYQDTALDTHRQSLLKLPEIKPYVSPSLFVRSAFSPTASMLKIDADEGERLEEILREHVSPAAKQVLEVTKESLDKAISICGPGVEYKKIGKIIHDHADKYKYGVVRQFVGHGVGRVFHADPVVLHFRNNEAGRMVLNQTFTIEPMLTIGSRKPIMWDDNWTVVTEDASLSAQFEHTILITKDGAEILTDC
ncbi:hypothetical protein F2Q68_00028694 [Brassica cretica]|uniref:Peptidase M24 domain-containing protein n=1 Tax=Brassica cretica TaxID=69181 RepID=A0A8S9GDQ7_BRACR|nr:hypothetical protein F2Q68_00028694 [Brassica cretica]